MMSCTAIVALTCAVAPAAALGDDLVGFEQVLPDNTVLILGTRSWAELESDFMASSLGALLQEEAFAPLGEAFDEDWENLGVAATKVMGFDPLAWFSMLSGPVAVVILDVRGSPNYEAGSFPLVMGMLVDAGDRAGDMAALTDDLLDLIREKSKLVMLTDDVAGEPVTTLVLSDPSGDEGAFARLGVHGSVLVMALGELGLEDEFFALWDALDADAERVLADARSFDVVPSSWQGEGVLFWADPARVLRSLRDSDAESDRDLFGGAEGQGVLDMFDQVGLTTLGPLMQTTVMNAEASRAEFALPWDAESVLGRFCGEVFVNRRPVLLDLAPTNVFSASVVNLDFQAMFDQVFELIIEFGGMSMADAATTIAEMDEAWGFSFRDELLVNLDGQVAFLQAEVDPAETFAFAGDMPVPTSFALLLGLSDGMAMRTLIDASVEHSPMRAALTREEFQGFDVYRLPQGLPGTTLFYAVTDDVLVVSVTPTLVHDVLRRKLSDDLPSLGRDERLRAMLGDLPPEAAVIQTSDQAMTFGTVLELLAKVAKEDPGRDNWFLRGMARIAEADQTAILEKHFDRPAVDLWWIGADGIRGTIVGP